MSDPGEWAHSHDDMNQTVLIRPLAETTPARATVYRLDEGEERIDEGPSNPDVELKTYIRKMIKKELSQGNRNFLLDLSAVEWIDSSYVGMILSWHQLVHSEDGEFVLVNLSDRSKGIMKVARLDTVFTVFNSPSEAMQYFLDSSR